MRSPFPDLPELGVPPPLHGSIGSLSPLPNLSHPLGPPSLRTPPEREQKTREEDRLREESQYQSL